MFWHINKRSGATPLQALRDFQLHHPDLHEVKLRYLNRLDPMASGLMLIAPGDHPSNQDLLHQDKTYHVESIIGISTTSDDLLGFPSLHSLADNNLLDHQVTQYLNKIVGDHHQPYPPYSSKPIAGKPLWYWTKHHLTPPEPIPTKPITIYSTKLISLSRQPLKPYLPSIITKISSIHGDFNQVEIIAAWQDLLNSLPDNTSLPVINFSIHCSSGTYIRSIIHNLGKELKSGSTATRIHRTSIGSYKLTNTTPTYPRPLSTS